MKKRLLSLALATGMTFSSLAGNPMELNLDLTDRNPSAKPIDNPMLSSLVGTKELKTKEGYNIVVTGSKVYTYVPGSNGFKPIRNLEVIFSDNDTELRLVDKEANGLSKGDYLILNHKFTEGDKIQVWIDYVGNNDFKINTTIHFKKRATTAESLLRDRVDTTSINALTRYFVSNKLAPVINWGNQLYGNIVDSAQKGSNLNLPYQDLKRALLEVEKVLPGIRSKEKGSEDALLKLSSEYLKIVKQQSKSSKK